MIKKACGLNSNGTQNNTPTDKDVSGATCKVANEGTSKNNHKEGSNAKDGKNYGKIDGNDKERLIVTGESFIEIPLGSDKTAGDDFTMVDNSLQSESYVENINYPLTLDIVEDWFSADNELLDDFTIIKCDPCFYLFPVFIFINKTFI